MPGKQVEFIKVKTPKAFKGLPPVTMLVVHPQTDRFILWVIANCKEALNINYCGQFITGNQERDEKLKKAIEVASTLKIRGLAKLDKDRNWHVTIKGQLFRFATHPVFPIAAPIFAALVAITLFILNRILSK